jgi:hypothetical protein
MVHGGLCPDIETRDSLSFDPKWPEEPYVYAYYIGNTEYGPEKANQYPNTALKGRRPAEWNDPPPNDRASCYMVDDMSNYNAITNMCPDYRDSTAGCSPLSWQCEMFG